MNKKRCNTLLPLVQLLPAVAAGSAPRIPAPKVSLPGNPLIYSIRLFRMGHRVKRSAKNLHGPTDCFCGQSRWEKSFTEKIKKWLTSKTLSSIIFPVSSA